MTSTNSSSSRPSGRATDAQNASTPDGDTYDDATGGFRNGRYTARRGIRDLVDLMENRFVVPGTDIRFGIDALLGVVPGVGDLLGSVIGLAVVVEGYRCGVPKAILVRMLFNLWLDGAIGSVPLVGDVADVFFRANRLNLELLERHATC